MRKKIITVFAILFFVLGCNSNKAEKYSDSFFSFDTYIQFDAYTSNEDDFKKYFEQTKSEFDKYHKLFDAYNSYKGLNNLKTVNDNAGKKPVKVDADLYNIIKDSKDYYKNSKQKNNIALAPVVLVYKDIMTKYDEGQDVKNPSMSLLKEKNKCTDINNIELRDDNTIYLKKSCAKIDVGSIAKGYTADKVAEDLEKNGLESGIINAGGNVVVIGKKPGNKDFSIGVADPNNPDDYSILIKSSDINIVTSGDYQRYYEIDNVKYNHIIDPDTLKPAQKNKSVSIITDDGLKADYFSTECFMLDFADIKELAKKFDFDYVVIDKNNKVSVSEGIKNEVEVK